MVHLYNGATSAEVEAAVLAVIENVRVFHISDGALIALQPIVRPGLRIFGDRLAYVRLIAFDREVIRHRFEGLFHTLPLPFRHEV